jgi:site-specific DNA-methyltransferase (adenine-specific)
MIEYRNKVLVGDCSEVMATLPNEIISCVITDPPYNYEFMNHKWDHAEIERRKARVKGPSKTIVKNIPYGSGLAGGVRNDNWYKRNRENVLLYQSWCKKWAFEAFRLLKSGGLVAVFNSTRTVAHVQVALEEVGFYTRDILVYRRHSGIPKGANIQSQIGKRDPDKAMEWQGWHSCLRNQWEAILVVQKPLLNNYVETLCATGVGAFYAEQGKGFEGNIIEGFSRDVEEKFDVHCTVKPLALMKYLIKLMVPPNKGHIVLDPFSGTGTTLVAARELGVDYLGIEIEPKYLDTIESRLSPNRKRQLSLI